MVNKNETRRIFKATRHGASYQLAKKLKIQPTNVYMWANKKANISAGRCIQIELLTDGAVTYEELNPNFDWDSVWKLFKKRYANEIETTRAC